MIPGRISIVRPQWLAVIAAVLCSLPASAPAAETVTPSQIRQNLFSTCFFDDKDGWVVGELGRILHTTDGGQTFERVGNDLRTAYLSIACVPGGTVVVTGQHGLMLRSRDRGVTWDKLDTQTTRNLLSVDFADANTGLAVGDFGTILRTTDGGTNWTPIRLPENLPLPEDIAEIIEPGDVLLYDIEYVTPERAWVVGEFGVILTTMDGGLTWTSQPSGVGTTLFGVHFADAERGWAAGIESVLLHTKDGGATWQPQEVASEKGFVLALYDVDVEGQFGWAIGDSGLLLRTTDGGETWGKVDLPIQLAASWLRGISLTPGARGMVVGGEGVTLALDQANFRELQHVKREF
jgi:photosystem II stability/assembly factor-like uncharacterized protein